MERNGKLTKLSQTLRKNMTRQERKLWYDFLSAYPVRFRRQVVIGNYIVDFYCHQAKLVVELDGSQHYSVDGQLSDENRTAYLQSLGLQVLRFSNLDINENLQGVCQRISQIVTARIPSSDLAALGHLPPREGKTALSWGEGVSEADGRGNKE